MSADAPARSVQSQGGVAGSLTARTLLVVAVGLFPSMAAAQGLGGVAREEAQRRERQRTADGQARTYSNADLRPGPEDAGGSPASASDGEPDRTDAAPEAPDPASDSAVDGDDADRLRERLDRAAARRKEQEGKWRARAAEVRAWLDGARKEYDTVCKTGGFSVPGG